MVYLFFIIILLNLHSFVYCSILSIALWLHNFSIGYFISFLVIQIVEWNSSRIMNLNSHSKPCHRAIVAVGITKSNRS